MGSVRGLSRTRRRARPRAPPPDGPPPATADRVELTTGGGEEKSSSLSELAPLGGTDDCVNPNLRPKRFLKVRFAQCPIALSLGVLGRKWTLLLLRNVGAYRIDRFNRLRESLPGIPPKVLSQRLRELEAAGLIRRVETRQAPRMVRWDLTEKGQDLVPVMMLITAFQSKWNAERLHPGRSPMRLTEMYDRRAMQLLRSFV